MRKWMGMTLTFALCTCLLAGCGGGSKSYKDGSYEGKSSVYESEDGSDDGNGYGVVNGTFKDEEYGKEDGRIANKDYYNKAQKANAARDEYASMLVQNGTLDGIDAISGATINYDEFVEAVNNALKEAEK